MNSWKEAPQLFFNGNFQLQLPNGNIEWIDTLVIPDITYDELMECKLIARNISDMSDEEICNLTGNKHTKEVCEAIRESLIRESNESDIRRSQYLYLLSLGIYPDNQNHNDIIWRYENTNR